MEYSIISEIGKREKNEDTYDIQQNIYNNIHYFAVFDGHAGDEVSQYLKLYFREILRQEITKLRGKYLNLALRNAIKILNREIRNKETGSTLCVLLIRGNLVYIANIGDSRCLLNNREYVLSTRDHKPDDPRELHRIYERGGFVNKEAEDAPARLNGHLAMSRAVGDLFLHPALINAPDVYKANIFYDKKNYLVLATDGLWDVFTNEELIHLIDELMRNNFNNEEISKEIIRQAYRKDFFDNLTCILITI